MFKHFQTLLTRVAQRGPSIINPRFGCLQQLHNSAPKRSIKMADELVADRLKPYVKETTVWHVMTPLSIKHKSMNLGQGFPDWQPPEFVRQAAKDAIDGDANQYARSAGHLPLVNALAEVYSPVFERQLNPLEEIVVTVGVTEGIYAAMSAFINPGDEVIVMEPFFDIYVPQVTMFGGVVKFIPLRPQYPDPNGALSAQDWKLDINELKSLITDKTKAILINNPHNPIGKVFTRSELEEIADVVRAHPRMLVFSDEVYEHIIFPEAGEYTRFATLPGMYERTLSFSSAGKTFAVTGWKIGWIIGPKELVKALFCAQAWIQFSIATPLQDAVARALLEAQKPYEGYPTYYKWLQAMYLQKRTLLVDALNKAGLRPIVPAGSFFTFADTSRANVPQSYVDAEATRDYAFCKWLTIDVGVTAIPPSAFYIEELKPLAENVARFAFCKQDATILEAGNRLEKAFAPQ
eukprot:Colp12_sorted_trinity150504_noHs@19470